MDIEKEFDKEFKDLLDGRTEIDLYMKTLKVFNTNDIHIEVSTYISYNDYDDEDYEVTEEDAYPGYHVSINPVNIENYEYALFDIRLPNKLEYPVEVEFKNLSRAKTYHFSNLENFTDFIRDTFKSDDYKNIIKRMEEVASNI